MKKFAVLLTVSVVMCSIGSGVSAAGSSEDLCGYDAAAVSASRHPFTEHVGPSCGSAQVAMLEEASETGAQGVVLSQVQGEGEGGAQPDEEDWERDPEMPIETIADPLEPINRAFYHFNDKLYFWLLRPAAQGYRAVVPRPVRVGVNNFFYNLIFPVRLVNCLFQGKFQGASMEFVRFVVNSTVGMAGLLDVATQKLEIDRFEEDLGQTLGVYGMGPAFYINWPVLGPSSLRDTFGLVGDAFLDPVNYAVPRVKYNAAVKAYKRVNATSLTIGDYEDLKRSALDPYVAIRDAYFQYRKRQIRE